MTPTVVQWKALAELVASLEDPHVHPGLPHGAFGWPPETPPPRRAPTHPDAVYVDIGILHAEHLVLRAVRFFTPDESAPEAGAPDVTVPREMAKWHYARPPWGCPLDLPSLATAVEMLRLPDDAFPPPGAPVPADIDFLGPRGVHYLHDGTVVVGVIVPLWRLLGQLGRLPTSEATHAE